MSYRCFRPDGGQRIEDLVALALEVGGRVICHPSRVDALKAAGVDARRLPAAGPLKGEVWVEVGQ